MVTSKSCKRCGETGKTFTRNKAKPDGLNIYCQDCCNTASRRWRNENTKQFAEIKKRYRDFNKDEIKDYMLRLRYGITLAQKKAMELEQKSKCKICFNESLPLVVDHCHKTKKIRGLLCSPCNRMLGSARDNPRILKAMISYLGEGNF